jgi:hypothetical protein
MYHFFQPRQQETNKACAEKFEPRMGLCIGVFEFASRGTEVQNSRVYRLGLGSIQIKRFPRNGQNRTRW